MVPVARRNLLAEKGRLAMSVGGVAFAVLLILVVVSLYRGWGEASSLFAELPGDLWVAQEGTSDPFRSASSLPADAAAALERIPGVAAVVPVYARRIAFPYGGRDQDVFFLSLDAPPGLPLEESVRERFLPDPGTVVIDGVVASETGVGVGEVLSVLGQDLEVASVRPGGNPIFQLAFLNAEDARPLMGEPGEVDFYLLAARPGADLTAVGAAARQAVPGSTTRLSAEFAESMNDLVNQGFLPVVGVLVGIGFVIGGAVIALTIYTSTIEKARDFGVLKAIGASNRFVWRIVLRQSLIVGITGAALGVLVSALVATLIKRGVPEFVTDLRALDAAGVFLIALLVSTAAAYVPVHRINRIDPAMVFRA